MQNIKLLIMFNDTRFFKGLLKRKGSVSSASIFTATVQCVPAGDDIKYQRRLLCASRGHWKTLGGCMLRVPNSQSRAPI